MAQTNINIRMDEELKKQFDNSSDSDPFYSSANMARLKKSIQQMETTGGTIHEVDDYD